jgi:hypothetical protein
VRPTVVLNTTSMTSRARRDVHDYSADLPPELKAMVCALVGRSS